MADSGNSDLDELTAIFGDGGNPATPDEGASGDAPGDKLSEQFYGPVPVGGAPPPQDDSHISQNIEDRRTTLNDDPTWGRRVMTNQKHGWDTLNNSMWFAAGGDVPDSQDQSPSFDDLPDAPQPQASQAGAAQAPQEASGFDDLPDHHAFDDLPDNAPQTPEGPVATFGREALHGAIPMAASLPGMAAGGELGLAAGAPLAPFTFGLSIPVFGFLGAALGGATTGFLADKAQDWIENAIGISDEGQRAVNAQANPTAAELGSLAPAAAAFKVGNLAENIGQRALTAGGMAGLSAAQQYAETGDVDTSKTLEAGGMGFVFNEERGPAARLSSIGRAAVGRFVPGRPGVTTTPEDAQTLQDSEVPPPPPGQPGVASEPAPNDADRRLPPGVASRLETATINTVRDRGNQGIYQKDAKSSDNTSIVTTGDIQPNIQAAIDANAPEPLPPQVTGQSTGIVEGAQEKGMLPPKAQAAVQQSAPESPLLGDRQPAPGSSEESPTIAAAADPANPKPPQVQVESADLPAGYIGRSNNDGTKVYVSPNVPEAMDVNGHQVPVRQAIAVHEIYERRGIDVLQDSIAAGKHPPMSDDKIYAVVHEKVGTAAERAFLEEHVGTPEKPFTEADWQEYQRQLRDLSVQNKDARGTPPADLYKFMDDQHYVAAHVHQAGDDMVNTARMQREALDAVHAKVRAGQGENADQDITGSLNPDRTAAPQVAPQAIGAPDAVSAALTNFGQPGAVTAAVREPPGKAKALELLAARADFSPENKAKLAERIKTGTPEQIKQAYNVLRRQPRPAVEGLGVQARDAGDLARKQQTVKAVQSAYDTFKPEAGANNPVGDFARAQLRTRLESAIAHATEQNGGKDPFGPKDQGGYKPAEKNDAYDWLREAKQLVKTRMNEKQMAKFIAAEKLIRAGYGAENRATTRIDADIGRSRRSGEEAVQHAEEENARTGNFDVPAEGGEGAPEPVTAESIKAEDAKSKEAVDLTKLSPEELTKLADEMLSHTPDALKRSILRRGKSGRPIETDRFKMGKSRAADSLESMFAEGKPVTKADAYRVRQAKDAAEEYAYSLSEGLNKLDKQEVSYNTDLQKHGESIPDAAVDEKLQERLYNARENDATKGLSARELTAYNRYNKPLFAENDKLDAYIREHGGENMIGPKVENHQARLRRGDDPSMDSMAQRTGANPLEGGRSIALKKSPQFDRHFQVLEHPGGKRQVIGINNDGKSFTKWNNYVATQAKEPIDFKAGGKFTHNGVEYTMREARTAEIENNARFEDGSKASYYHNSLLSAMVTNRYLHAVVEHMRFIEKQKTALRDAGLMFDNKKYAPDDFVKPKLPQFDDKYVHPQIAHVLNDYHDAGLGLTALKGISRFLTKTLFWNPVAHIANVGTHWFVARGKDWAWPPAYTRLVKSAGEAMKSVITQDEEYRRIQDAGAGLVLGGVLQKDGLQNMAKGIRTTMDAQPEQWKRTADILGVGVPQLGRAIMNNASKVMWAANDMFLMQLVKEGEAKGMTTREAIAQAEKHFPNYRVGSTLMGSGQGARFLSQVMQDQSVFAFGRYHVGMIQSFAHIAKDLAVGTGHQRLDAIGHIMALGILGLAVKPALDKMAQLVSGNPTAYANPRGPLTLPTHLARAAQGKEDFMQGARGVMTLNPAITTLMETFFNKDFAGNPIVQPGDFANAAHGSPRAAGKVLVAEGSHAAQGAISPLNTLAGSGKVVQGKPIGVSGQLRDQVTDVHNTSDKENAWLAKQPLKAQQAIKAADKRAGPVMKTYLDATRGLP